MYEDEKEGILNCDSFEKKMKDQKTLESLRGGTFIVAQRDVQAPASNEHTNSKDVEKSVLNNTLFSPGKMLNRSFADHFFVFANSQIKDLLNSFCPNKMERAFDAPFFSIFNFDELTMVQDML